jgi:hypothetical protein
MVLYAIYPSSRSRPCEVLALVRDVHPGCQVTPIDDGVLGDVAEPDRSSAACHSATVIGRHVARHRNCHYRR